MKNSIIVIALLVTIAAKAQTGSVVSGPPAALPKPTPYQIVERGANQQVWERTVYELGTNGTVVAKKHRLVELATGKNYLKNGQWVESSEQITILPQGGAQAVQGQHQAKFPGNIYKGQIELVTPDNKHLKSRPLAISFDDGQNTVLIGQLKHSVGVLVASNRVIYPDAFSGIKADIVFEISERLVFPIGGFKGAIADAGEPGFEGAGALAIVDRIHGIAGPRPKSRRAGHAE